MMFAMAVAALPPLAAAKSSGSGSKMTPCFIIALILEAQCMMYSQYRANFHAFKQRQNL